MQADLPCPFCSHDEIGIGEFTGKGRKVKYALQCNQCLACGPICNTKEQALIGWYMRDGEQQPLGEET